MTKQESTSTEKRTQSAQGDDLEMVAPSKIWLLVPIVLIAGAIFLAR